MQLASNKASTPIITPIQVPTIDTVDGATVGRYSIQVKQAKKYECQKFELKIVLKLTFGTVTGKSSI